MAHNPRFRHHPFTLGLGFLCLHQRPMIDSISCTPDKDIRVFHLYLQILSHPCYLNPITLQGRRGTTDEFATIPFHLDLFSAALVSWQSPFLSTLWYCFPTSSSVCLFFFFLSLCPVGLSAKPEDLETWPNHLSFRFLTRVRSSSYSPMAAWIFPRTSSLVTWSLYEMFNSLR